MKTYKLTSDWPPFQKFVIDNLSDYKDDFVFMYKDSEIYIRTKNEKALKIIKKKYSLTLSKQPSLIFDDPGWGIFGNKNLLDIP